MDSYMQSDEKPTVTLYRRREHVVRHKCMCCDHTTLTITGKAMDRKCSKPTTEDCKSYNADGLKPMFASKRFNTVIRHEGKTYIFRVKEDEEDDYRAAFPDAELYPEMFYKYHDELPFMIKMQKKQDRWYCWDCPCNGGETKVFKSHTGLWNHKKKCPNHN